MTPIEQGYADLQKLVILLLEFVGGQVEITDKELADFDPYGKSIEISRPNLFGNTVVKVAGFDE